MQLLSGIEVVVVFRSAWPDADASFLPSSNGGTQGHLASHLSRSFQSHTLSIYWHRMAITCVMASFSGLRVSSRPSHGGFSSAVSGTRLTGTSRYLCPQSAYYMDSSMHPRHSSQMGRIPPNPGIVAACAVPVSSPGATPLPFFFVSSYLRTLHVRAQKSLTVDRVMRIPQLPRARQ